MEGLPGVLAAVCEGSLLGRRGLACRCGANAAALGAALVKRGLQAGHRRH